MLPHLTRRTLGEDTGLSTPPWPIRQLGLAHTFQGHRGCVNCCRWSLDGKYVITGSDDRRIIVYDTQRVNRPAAIDFDTSHRGNVFDCVPLGVSLDAGIVSCSLDGRVLHHTLSPTGAVSTSRLYTHAGASHKMGRVGDSDVEFFSCGEDGRVVRYDLRVPNARTFTIRLRARRLLDCSVCPLSDHLLLLAGDDIFVHVVDTRKNCVSSFTPSSEAAETMRNSWSMNSVSAAWSSAYSGGRYIVASYSGHSLYTFDYDASQQYEGRIHSLLGGRGFDFSETRSDVAASSASASPTHELPFEQRALAFGVRARGVEPVCTQMAENEVHWVGDPTSGTRAATSLISDRSGALPSASRNYAVAAISERSSGGSSLIDSEQASLNGRHSTSSGNSTGRDSSSNVNSSLISADLAAAASGSNVKPSFYYLKSYSGHRNIDTIKGVTFFGAKSEYIVTGCDSGRVFIYDTESGDIVTMLKGHRNERVRKGEAIAAVNCVSPHPLHLPVLLTSGILPVAKMWSPCRTAGPVPPELIARAARSNNALCAGVDDWRRDDDRIWLVDDADDTLDNAHDDDTDDDDGEADDDEGDDDDSSEHGDTDDDDDDRLDFDTSGDDDADDDDDDDADDDDDDADDDVDDNDDTEDDGDAVDDYDAQQKVL